MDIRINKYIASTGFCSRRRAETYIKEGRVKVNDEVITELGTVISREDIVKIDDRIINIENNKVYIMFNKPKGVISTAKEQFGRKSVLDSLKVKERVYPVGRLDMDSEGLILLTNDGDFLNNVIHPTKHISKTYVVELKNKIEDEAISKLEDGVDIGGYTTKPCIIEKMSNKKIKLTIFEGKNRQIRRMIECVNNKVVSLKRISIGKLELNDLKSGDYIFLDDSDIEKVFE